MKKLILGASLMLASVAASANDGLIIYKCKYRIERPGREDFIMSGNIIANDVISEEDATYLTLAPPQTTNINIHARVLITADDYNPMSLHATGKTATPFAIVELKGNGNEVSHKDSAGVLHVLQCLKR